MGFTKKAKYLEAAPEKGRSIVYYRGGHPWKALALVGVIDKEDNSYVATGMTSYEFERIDPSNQQRYCYVDLPQHLLWFVVQMAVDPEKVFEVKATGKHKKSVESLNKAYKVRQNGELVSRADIAQLEADVSMLLGEM